MEKAFKQVDFDKLSDDLMLLGFNTILRFNVILSKQVQDNKRYHYHHEYVYDTNKYADTKSLITLRRQFDFYISIENIKNNESGYKEFIQIRARDIIYVRDQLNYVCNWFRNEEFNIFAYNKEKKLIILGEPEPVYILNLSMDKFIKITPSIIKYNSMEKIGVRLYLSSDNVYVDIDIDRYMEFVYFMNSINMYQSAQLLINYLQRPDFGTNSYKFDKYPTEYVEDGYITEAPKRKIENKNRQRSFFDKMDSLE